jgi:radical SAM superfamily enzyme YgiQ (UPF0313 family)
MKILLVNPPIPNKFRMFEYADEEGRRAILRRILVGPPLGLCDLAGMLPDEDIVILDQKTELDKDPNYDFVEALAKEVEDFKPEIVGFTCLTAQYNSVKKIISAVKKINSKILTVVGGVHPSLCPEDFTGTDVDIISIGVGKVSFYQIVQEYKRNKDNADYQKIPGLAINRGSSLCYTKSLSELSYEEFQNNHLMDNVFPNRSLTDKYNYIFPQLNKKVQYISTSQGCTHKCNFCTIWPLTHGHYFYREAESIISELKTMDAYPVIRFCDANTFGNVPKAKELFTRIIEEGLNKHQYFGDLRTDTVINHPDLIQLAAKAGLKAVVCGLESTSDEELRSYGKGNSIEATKQALQILNEAGIYVNGNYIIRPDYDEADFERVGRFIEENPIYHSGLTILTPFPGTEQWEELKDQVVIKDLDYYNLTNAVLRTKLPEKEFYEKLTEVYKISGKASQKYFAKYGKPEYEK